MGSSQSNKFSHEILIDCVVSTFGKTGVEMEALNGVSGAALCVYDMLKAVSHEIRITDIQLATKTGGKSDLQIPIINSTSDCSDSDRNSER